MCCFRPRTVSRDNGAPRADLVRTAEELVAAGLILFEPADHCVQRVGSFAVSFVIRHEVRQREPTDLLKLWNSRIGRGFDEAIQLALGPARIPFFAQGIRQIVPRAALGWLMDKARCANSSARGASPLSWCACASA